ncbi:MAG: helix-turn-helix domain-containing protein [Acidimicrobiales bacterium]
MQMVEDDEASVEQRLRAGQIACQDCGGELRPWGFARWRKLRKKAQAVAVHPRRSRCRRCGLTHVLLPTVALLRRVDVAEVIVEALVARYLEGRSRSETIRLAGVPPGTGRAWLRRFRSRAEVIRVHFTALAWRWDSDLAPLESQGSPARDALCAIGAAAQAAARSFGPTPLSAFVAGATGGRLISNTNLALPEAP